MMLIKIEDEKMPFLTWINTDKIINISLQSRFGQNDHAVVIHTEGGFHYVVPFPILDDAKVWIDKLLTCINGRL